MKKIMIIFLTTILLSGCSLFEEATTVTDYVDEATQFIQDLSGFATDVPQMAIDAATNKDIYNDLNNQVTNLIENIEQFNAIDVPKVAEDVHQQIVVQNQDLLDDLKNVVVNGNVALEDLVNSEAFQTISQIVKLLVLINQLTG